MFPNQLACILLLLAKATALLTVHADAPAAASQRACTRWPPPTNRRLAGLAKRHSRLYLKGSPRGSIGCIMIDWTPEWTSRRAGDEERLGAHAHCVSTSPTWRKFDQFIKEMKQRVCSKRGNGAMKQKSQGIYVANGQSRHKSVSDRKQR